MTKTHPCRDPAPVRGAPAAPELVRSSRAQTEHFSSAVSPAVQVSCREGMGWLRSPGDVTELWGRSLSSERFHWSEQSVRTKDC